MGRDHQNLMLSLEEGSWVEEPGAGAAPTTLV